MADSGLFAGGCLHPLGLGAGPDRGGERCDAAVAAGFAFIELGTVTPRPEPDHNPGAAVLAERCVAMQAVPHCLLGASIGSQFASPPEAIAEDWLVAFARLAPVVGFITINLSAPYYARLLRASYVPVVIDAIGRVAQARRDLRAIPLLVKLPFGRGATDDVLGLLQKLPAAGVDGIVVSSVVEAVADAACHIRAAHQACGLPIVATGGVRTPSDLANRLAAGAQLVQIYSPFADGETSAVAALIKAASACGGKCK